MSRPQTALRPLCHCCGKALKKVTTSVRFNMDPEPLPSEAGRTGVEGRSECPTTKAEAQRLINLGTVVSVRRGRRREYKTMTVDSRHRLPGADDIGKIYRTSTSTDDDIIVEVSVWDGKSYVDLFCNNKCAITFAHAFALAGHRTVPATKALEEQWRAARMAT